jgi:hypothetical protein
MIIGRKDSPFIEYINILIRVVVMRGGGGGCAHVRELFELSS